MPCDFRMGRSKSWSSGVGALKHTFSRCRLRERRITWHVLGGLTRRCALRGERCWRKRSARGAAGAAMSRFGPSRHGDSRQRAPCLGTQSRVCATGTVNPPCEHERRAARDLRWLRGRRLVPTCLGFFQQGALAATQASQEATALFRTGGTASENTRRHRPRIDGHP